MDTELGFIVISSLLVVLFLAMYWNRRRKKKDKTGSFNADWDLDGFVWIDDGKNDTCGFLDSLDLGDIDFDLGDIDF